MSWQWVDHAAVFAIHDSQIATHGGFAGIRDLNAVLSALGRAQNMSVYGNPPPDIADLAAAYIFGIASSHGFSDGNKRTAWVVGRLFLAINNKGLVYNNLDAINFMINVAAGEVPEKQVAEWVRQRLAA